LEVILKIKPSPQQVRKFYLLEYFYVLLKSIERHSDMKNAFEMFKLLKDNFSLGESKYKKLTVDKENQTIRQIERCFYTFRQVISEAKDYGLIHIGKRGGLQLTDGGKKLLSKYEQEDFHKFNKALFTYMEKRFYAFYELIRFCYKANSQKSGLLIFPIYTPLKLGFERNNIKTTGDIINYSNALQRTLEEDIEEFFSRGIDLTRHREQLIHNLMESGLLPKNNSEKFAPEKYNSIIIRFRKFWLGAILKEIYGYEYSTGSLDIWAYRGKQIGVCHATEFYPGFSGRIIYPTSVIIEDNATGDFEELFRYPDGNRLYIHSPSWEKEKTQNKFVDSLLDSYFSLRRTNRSYFINLADIRELVCYNMRISQYLFDSFLEKAYFLNLKGHLKVKISLEADKLPQETKALYLRREPVMVDGKYRNIIAIDVSKRRRS